MDQNYIHAFIIIIWMKWALLVGFDILFLYVYFASNLTFDLASMSNQSWKVVVWCAIIRDKIEQIQNNFYHQIVHLDA
jgi:hypothetical protein